ncbi:LuxR family transcriptional regulator [Streptomyces sp. NPDC047082]|uniref:LuxR family transcriptional regulator n=1 Tax=Streptomyces sp. NPDC047082 TaxID=3155259 RepID=UPI0033E048DE
MDDTAVVVGAAVADRAMRAAGDGPVPVGRDHERDLLERLLDGLPDSGGALILSGDPGIGKSVLLQYAVDRCRTTVLRAGGVESEAVLPYTVLADLLLPLRAYFAELPSAQRRAVEGCLALADAGEPNPYAVCAGALGVLTAAGEERPLLVVVDDLHWVDPSSRQVLQFVARRLTTERVALVMATRTGTDEDGAWESVPRAALAPLVDDDCWALLRRHGLDRADAAAGRLVRLAQGNPLVLVEYGAALARSRAMGADPWDQAWEAPGPLVERAWRGRLRALPGRTQQALVYVAACRTPELTLLAGALAGLGMGLDALDAAEEAGLVRLRDGVCELRHPVLRPVVLAGSSTARRLEVYRRLAALSSGELQTWYLAAAAPGPDEEVAARLAEDAERARGRGALAAAAHAWHRAAELSPDPADAARRLLDAARDAFYGGTTRDAAHWCEQALAYSRDPRLTADIELLRGQACTWLGDPARAHRLLVDAARAVQPVDRSRACLLYGAAVAPATMDGRLRRASDIAAHCQVLADGGRDTQRRHAAVMRAKAQALGGDVRAGRAALLALLDEGLAASATDAGHGPAARVRHLTEDIAHSPEERQVAMDLAQGLAWTDHEEVARRVLDAVIEVTRRGSSPTLLPYALLGRCEVEMWTRWPTARADATEALRWAEEFGHLAMTGYALMQLARLDGLRGDTAGCEERVAQYERWCGDRLRGLSMFAQGALGTAALTAGDPDGCRTHLEAAFHMADEMGLVNPNLMPWVADLAEACLRTGARNRAVAIADWLAERARATSLAWPAAAHARCRVMLARSADEAADWLSTAELAHTRREMPFERARTRLVGGEVLRRLRRPSAAHEPLLSAQRTFSALGALPWAARAGAEVAAAGHRTGVRRAEPDVLELLTPQEFQVARAIGEGLSNVEAAASLFLSRKTIEAHLTRVYRKLGVRSRSDLARCLAHAGLVG